MNKITGVLVSVSLPLLVSCATTPPPSGKSLLEVREMQTRSYETRDAATLMKALASVLQDNAFIIEDASTEMGLISAKKQERAEFDDIKDMPPEGISGGVPISFGGFTVTVGGTDYVPTRIVECTANVSERSNQLRVRVLFAKAVLDAKGKVFKAGRVADKDYYQRFFAALDNTLVTLDETH